MKFAFIILCHKNETQINRLLNKLKNFDCEIFIHIDRKNKNLKNDIKICKNIHILPEEDSYDIKWGGIDMILATLSLINNVVSFSENNNIKFDYVWLLSGQDYIIQNSKIISEKLKQNKKINYIEIIGKGNKKYKKLRKLYELPYPQWITINKTYIKIVKRLYMIITGGYNYTFPFFRRKKPFDFDFYFGSQWWTITYDCANYIKEYCTKNDKYIRYFEKSIIPDECFFQTIIMQSKYSKSIQNNLTYINWGKNRRSPETITIEDFAKLKKINNEYFFARKFDIDEDKKIVDKIDEIIK